MKAIKASTLVFMLIFLLSHLTFNVQSANTDNIVKAISEPVKKVVNFPTYESPSEIYGGGYGYVGGVLYVYKSSFTFVAIPDIGMNTYASLILGEGLKVKEFIDLGNLEGAAKNKLASMTSWLLDNSVGGLWRSETSGSLPDVYLSALVIKSIAYSYEQGLLPKEKEGDFVRSVSALISLQSQGGGWGAVPGSNIAEQKEPDPEVTAQVLSTLVAVKSAGLNIPGLDTAINKAISFLEGTAKKGGGKTYWSIPRRNTFQITAEISNSLADALILGYKLRDNSLIKGIINYLEPKAKESYSAGTYDIATAEAVTALAKLSALGYIDTEAFVQSWLPMIEDFALSIRPDGLFGNEPFIWLRLYTTMLHLNVFSYWVRMTCLSMNAYLVGGYGDYNPPVVIEGTGITLKISLKNKVSSKLNLGISVGVDPPAKISSTANKAITLSPGKSTELSIKILVPDKIPNKKNVTVYLYVKEGNPLKPLLAKTLNFLAVRNPEIIIKAKTINPNRVSLKEPVTITLKIQNTGDLPLSNVKITEILNKGFTVVPGGNGTVLLSSSESLGSYVLSSPIGPGEIITFSYKVQAEDVPPGPQQVSRTVLMYTDARGETHNKTADVSITVLRPLVSLTYNATEMVIEWDSSKTVVASLSNSGNEDATDLSIGISPGEGIRLNLTALPEGVYIKPNPDGSFTLKIKRIKAGESLSLPISVKATNFYPSLDLGTYLSIKYEYKDSKGRNMPSFSGSGLVKLRVVASQSFFIIIALITAVVIVLVAIRVYNRRKIARREERRASPFIRQPPKKRRGRRPFGS